MRAPATRRPPTPASERRALLLALEAAFVLARAEFLVRHPIGEDYVPRLAWLRELAAPLVRRGLISARLARVLDESDHGVALETTAQFGRRLRVLRARARALARHGVNVGAARPAAGRPRPRAARERGSTSRTTGTRGGRLP
jgi:hypothetical protein